MDMHQLYGKLAEELEGERTAHRATVDLLRKVIAGEVDPELVVVTDYTWTVGNNVPQEVTDAIHREVLEIVEKKKAG